MTKLINKPSFMSLYIQMYFGEQLLSSATGFAVFGQKGPLLVTNRHNLTGRHQENGKPLSSTGGTPDRIRIFHNRLGQLGSWISKTEMLYNGDKAKWIEHPILQEKADFVALPLRNVNDVQIHAYKPADPGVDMIVGPAEAVSVVGFPFGLRTGGSLAVWATGFVASEPDIDYNGFPVFLIDCRSRQGQSGSPVIAYRSGGVVSTTEGTKFYAEPTSRFLGIYSGRVTRDSDLGLVWKASAISELVAVA